MKTFNHIQRFVSAIIFCLSFSVSSFGQTSITTQFGNIIATLQNNGVLFYDTVSPIAGFEVPAGSGLSTIFASSLWIGGLDDTLGLHVAAPRFANEGNAFYPGPLTISGATNENLMASYNHIYLANKADVDNHINYFNALQNGSVDIMFPDGYFMPTWMIEWPVAIADLLCGGSAPFVDADANGMYNPEYGDYPCFKGDQCAYIIFNDNGGIHSESGGAPLKVTVHLMLYAFTGLGEDIANTLFANYTLFNCSDSDYQETYIGKWTDLDIGFASDDYVGSHIEGGFYYAFNGDSLDEPGFISLGYGLNTPIQSVVFLQGPKMDSDGLDNAMPEELNSYNTYGPYGPGYNDGVIDNEHLGMTSFVYYRNSNNPINGEPSIAPHFYNYMQSKWKNGQAMQFGGNGVSGTGVISDLNALCMFPGNSDPHNINTNGIIPPSNALPWTELTSNNPPGDRRSVAASGPFTFAAGDTITFDIAYQYSEESGTPYDEITLAYINSNLAREVFNGSTNNCEFTDVVMSTNNLAPQTKHIELYPNPTTNSIHLRGLTDYSTHYFIEDVAGKLIQKGILIGENVINTEKILAGEYIIRLHDIEGNMIAVKRFQKVKG